MISSADAPVLVWLARGAARFDAARLLWLSLIMCACGAGCAGDDFEAHPGVAGSAMDAGSSASADDDAARAMVDASTSGTRGAASDADAAEVPDAGSGQPGADAGPSADDGGSRHFDASDAGHPSLASDAGSDAGMPDASRFPPSPENLTLFVAGDSTSAIFPASDPTHRVGWASVLQPSFKAGVRVDDAAQSGRSSKSFLDEGLWRALKAKIRPGDYVFVQFGHNDEKMDDPARYTDPSTTFRSNLKTYVSETRAAGGIPVLLTPISRRQFSGSKIVASHGAYPAAVTAVAQETATPCIDMTEKTRILLEGLGPTGTLPLFATNDNTHLSAQGAEAVAKLVVQGIREQGLPLAGRLSP